MTKKFQVPSSKFQIQKGFTLIEMIVVASIVAILSAVSIAAFADFNKSQTISIAASSVSTMLTTARSRAQSQVKPSVGNCSSSTLEGYGVRICGVTGSASGCTTANTYQLHIICGGQWNRLTTTVLPEGISFVANSTPTVFFRLLSGGVDNAITPKTIILTGNNQTKTITITSVGSITTN